MSVQRTLELAGSGGSKRVRRYVLGRLAPDVRRGPAFTLPLRWGATILATRPLQEVVVGRAVRGAARRIVSGDTRGPFVVGSVRLDPVLDGAATNVGVELRVVGSGLAARAIALLLRPLWPLAGAAAGRWLLALDRAVGVCSDGSPDGAR